MGPNDIPVPVEMGGLNTAATASTVYPDAVVANNVRWGLANQLMKSTGYTTYNSTAMPATIRAVTGVFQFNRRDTTTRYTIACTKEKIFVVPTSGAWTTLRSSLGAGDNDYWDATVFDNELILVNGVDAPSVTDGTVGGSAALVNQTSVQVRTAMTSAQSLGSGLHHVEDGTLIGVCGATAAGGYDGKTQSYDTIADAWVTKTRSVTNRDEAPGWCLDGKIYVAAGLAATTTWNFAGEVYDHTVDAWSSIAGFGNASAGVRSAVAGVGNNMGWIQTGNTSNSAAAWSTTNYQYDPITNSGYAVKTAYTGTARRAASGFSISSKTYVTSGRITAADAYDADHRGYTTFTDSWADLTNLTAARWLAGGSVGRDNLGYIVGGLNDADAETSTIYSYNDVTNAWSTSAATITTAKSLVGVAPDDWYLYIAGGAVSTTAQSSVDRYSNAPAAPVAHYVESFTGQVIMARTTTAPSRLFYSTPGTSRIWDPDAHIDVNADDGDWITSLFVFDGRLYVSKKNTMFQIGGDAPFDPVESIPTIIPLENVKGTVSNRSVVVTDIGVFYLAEDGFRVFDGARSIVISDKIKPTLESYVQSRNKYTAGLWNRARNEIWWSMTASGTTHNRIVVFNLQHKKWSIFTFIAAESMAPVEDANDNDQILFGTADTNDGKLYKADSTEAANGSAISAEWQSGWIQAGGGLREITPGALFVWMLRSGNWTTTFATRVNYGSTDVSTDSPNLSTKNPYFNDTTDQRAEIRIGSASAGHAFSLVITNAGATQRFEIGKMTLMVHQSPSGGSYPATSS